MKFQLHTIIRLAALETVDDEAPLTNGIARALGAVSAGHTQQAASILVVPKYSLADTAAFARVFSATAELVGLQRVLIAQSAPWATAWLGRRTAEPLAVGTQLASASG
jgi:hypothetical protein